MLHLSPLVCLSLDLLPPVPPAPPLSPLPDRPVSVGAGGGLVVGGQSSSKAQGSLGSASKHPRGEVEGSGGGASSEEGLVEGPSKDWVKKKKKKKGKAPCKKESVVAQADVTPGERLGLRRP